MNNASRSSVRRGFSLVELVSSLAITSILMLGLSSVMLIGSKAVPTGTEQIHAEAACNDAIEKFAHDATLAIGVSLVTSEKLVFVVPDRDGDASNDQVSYILENSSTVLKRGWNAETPSTLLSGLDSASFKLFTSDGKATMVVLTISNPALKTPNHTLRVELYNNPAVK
jgi:prepilin-type N-terminal cleavage/methylation domain-containing protein